MLNIESSFVDQDVYARAKRGQTILWLVRRNHQPAHTLAGPTRSLARRLARLQCVILSQVSLGQDVYARAERGPEIL